MANTYLSRTYSANATNGNKFTFSCWVKRGKLGTRQMIFSAYDDGAGGQDLEFEASTDVLSYNNTGGDNDTNMVFRDTSAWYHIVLAVDTTQGSASTQVKIYVNGEQVSLATNSGASAVGQFGKNGETARIGSNYNGSNYYFDGSMSHFHFIDGTAYDASAFGETDTTTGEWKAKTSPSVTYGNNGFFILKDGNSVTDQSGKGNNFTVGGGTLTDLKDNPDNVFATGNPLNVNSGAVGTFSNGNNTIKVANSSGPVFGSSSTIGASSGKWYCEAKIITRDSTMIGVTPSPSEDARNNIPPTGANSSGAIGCLIDSGNKYVSGNGTTYGAATAEGGIMMIALDLDNLKVYFGSGGQWANGSGAWNQAGLTSGAAISITAVASTAEGAYFFSFGDGGGSAKGKVAWNFGNGYFETTAITTNSGNGYSGAEGSSKFNYTVPTGYSALSTKGLNE